MNFISKWLLNMRLKQLEKILAKLPAGGDLVTDRPIKWEFMSQVNLKQVCDKLKIIDIESQ